MDHRKDCRQVFYHLTRIFIILVFIVITLIPLSSLFAFDPDYPDFIWTYNMKEGKISSGTQKAVYLTGYSMASEQKMQDIYRMVEETELNAIMFNVKEDSGEISYDSQIKFFIETGSVKPVYDIDNALKEMDERGIYSIARIVLFKDNVITRSRPDLAVQDKNTGSRIYLDGGYWLDIYNRDMWDHYIDLVLELAEKGVNEVQVRLCKGSGEGSAQAVFPANGSGYGKDLGSDRVFKCRKGGCKKPSHKDICRCIWFCIYC